VRRYAGGLSSVTALVLRAEDSAAARRQAASLQVTAHRPWRLPRGPWISGQTWRDLLFAHWPVEAGQLAPFVPDGLALDRYDGTAWLGVIPFEVCALRARPFPPAPGLSGFLETNVRTYVTNGDRPGILFLTLEASSALAVALARTVYRLPYHHAAMTRTLGERIDYRSERDGVKVEARYAAEGPAAPAPAGSLDAFLVERYRLYTRSAGVVLRADIHHRPWLLHRAAPGSTIAAELGGLGPITLAGAPRLHVAATQDAVVWPLLPAGRSRQA
jgi:uncharacterized protein YqjF (DUF2071 family)